MRIMTPAFTQGQGIFGGRGGRDGYHPAAAIGARRRATRGYSHRVISRRFASLGPLLLVSCAVFAACSSGNGPAGSGGAGTSSSTGINPTGGAGGGVSTNMCAGGTVGGDRPVTVYAPSSYDCKKAVPLVLLLHDYASSGAAAESYFDLTAQSDAQGFLYAHPDGTKDSKGNEFWNATDACCNADGSKVDDSTYLSNVISDVQAQYNVDPTRVFVLGYGNGGFMAYRLACDHADQITAVASLGGATWDVSSKCALQTAVSVVEIHGTDDATFLYAGGTNLGNPYPAATATASDWATLDRCKGAPSTSLPPLDLDATLPGAETAITEYTPCFGGSTVELWTIQGGSHKPTFAAGAVTTIVGHLLAQTRP
jgi:polyhydroxybutyrate depolymerase